MKTNDERPKAAAYLFVLAIQILGAILFVWQQLPEFGRLVVNPGAQLPYDVVSDVMTVAALAVMQILFCCLFAPFCTSLEVERLGQAFEGDKVGLSPPQR